MNFEEMESEYMFKSALIELSLKFDALLAALTETRVISEKQFTTSYDKALDDDPESAQSLETCKFMAWLGRTCKAPDKTELTQEEEGKIRKYYEKYDLGDPDPDINMVNYSLRTKNFVNNLGLNKDVDASRRCKRFWTKHY